MDNVLLTQRDRSLITKIAEFGFLSTPQIRRTVFPGIDRSCVLRRLRHLKRRKYIRPVSTHTGPWQLWLLGKKAEPMVPDDKLYGGINRNWLEHDERLAEVRLQIEKGFPIEEWVPSHELRNQWLTRHANDHDSTPTRAKELVPDGLFWIKNKKGNLCSCALELELTVKSRSRYLELLSRYTMKDQVSAFWYIMPTELSAQRLHEVYQKIIPHGSAYRLFTSQWDETLRDPLHAKIVNKGETASWAKYFTLDAESPDHTQGHSVVKDSEMENTSESDNTLEQNDNHDSEKIDELEHHSDIYRGVRGEGCENLDTDTSADHRTDEDPNSEGENQ